MFIDLDTEIQSVFVRADAAEKPLDLRFLAAPFVARFVAILYPIFATRADIVCHCITPQPSISNTKRPETTRTDTR